MVNWYEQQLENLPLDVYDGRNLGSWEGLTDGLLDDKF